MSDEPTTSKRRRGRPKIPESERRNKTLRLWISKRDETILENASRDYPGTRSDWIRERLGLPPR